MKKILAIIMCAVMALTVTACSNDNEIPYSKSDKDKSTSDKADKDKNEDKDKDDESSEGSSTSSNEESSSSEESSSPEPEKPAFELKSGQTEDFKYTPNADGTGYKITQYIGTKTDVVVPAEIDGAPVLEVAGISYKKNITSITVPDSVATIGDSAFHHCTGLTSVVLGNGLTTIEDNAFRSCGNLKSMDIPDSVTSLGRGGFGDGGLTTVTYKGKSYSAKNDDLHRFINGT